MGKRVGRTWWIVLILLLTATMGNADDRALKKVTDQSSRYRGVALVIGNSVYKSAPLKNPVHDAIAMATELQKARFDVTLKINVDHAEMFALIREFGDKLMNGGVGLFYFAGHGLNVDGKNYLIPIDADIQREDEVPSESIEADLILRKMDSANNGLNIVILDACRNNPFSDSFQNASGLGRMDAPRGTLLVYATRPGYVAADGDGENGVFTRHLIDKMRIPGLDLVTLVGDVAAAVESETNNAQQPWIEGSPKGARFCFYEPVKTGKISQDPAIAVQDVEKTDKRDENVAKNVPIAQAQDRAEMAKGHDSLTSERSEPKREPPYAEKAADDLWTTGTPVAFREYIHSELGERKAGEIVEITLTNGANVRLMDAENFLAYKEGLQYRFVGGLFLESPVRISMPSTGYWHVTIDMDGLKGSTSATTKILNRAFPGKK
jgi:hypothetical protein